MNQVVFRTDKARLSKAGISKGRGYALDSIKKRYTHLIHHLILHHNSFTVRIIIYLTAMAIILYPYWYFAELYSATTVIYLELLRLYVSISKK